MAKKEKKESGRKPRFDMMLRDARVIKKVYHDKEIVVNVRADGFHYGNKVYTSLSKLATDLTGVSTNGPLFFGLRGEKKAKAAPKAKAKKTAKKSHRKNRLPKQADVSGDPAGEREPATVA